MRSFGLVIATLALSFISLPAVVHARVTRVEEQNGRIVVDVDFRVPSQGRGTVELHLPGMPRVRYERVLVAVPEGVLPRARVFDGEFNDRTGELPAINAPVADAALEASDAQWKSGGFYPATPHVVGQPFIVRGTRLVAIDCFATQTDYSGRRRRDWTHYRLEIEYRPAARTRPLRDVDPVVARLAINRDFFPVTAPVLRSARMSDPQFSRSQNWVKIRIANAGMYVIRGTDLALIGVNVGAINDPNSFRLFTGGGRELPRDLSQPGTWSAGTWMRECAIRVDYGGDGTFDPNDRVIFYGLGVEEFADLYEPGLSREEHVEHLYEDENVYFLCWDETSSFPASPVRMADVTASPTVNPDVTTFEDRLYFEENRVRDFNYGGDGWQWISVTRKQGPETISLSSFVVHDIDPTQPQTFHTLAVAAGFGLQHHVVYRFNGVDVTDFVWDSFSGDRFRHADPVTYQGSFLQNGINSVSLRVPRDLNTVDFMYFSHYAVFYHRMLKALNDALFFSSPDTSGTINFAVSNFGSGAPLGVFDVTNPFLAMNLQGFTENSNGGSRTLRFSAAIASGRRYFWAGAESALRKPPAMARLFPRDLRAVTQGPNMVIITNPNFQRAAETLRRHRQMRLPHFPNPVIEVVTTEDVYDNFSGGIVDAVGIRNYIKFLYDNFRDGNGDPRLTYVLLLGDANADFRNNASSQPNYVTTNLNLRPAQLDAYTTDDWFALLDPADITGLGFLDVAVGRLPADSPSEADLLVDKIVDYETTGDFAPWRDKIILSADDEQSPAGGTRQGVFISQSQSIAHGFMPSYLDPVKLYLTEFPRIQGIKPAARLMFLKDWNAGCIAINFVGHGSSVQMADEQMFVASDVGNLRNGVKMPVFMAWSCTVGNFADAQAKSLSEKLLLREQGGAIATITASELSIIGPNGTLNTRLFPELFATDQGPPEALGIALMVAKVISTTSKGNEENHNKYNLLGDPALQLAVPRRAIALNSTDVDTLTTGLRATIRGSVLNASGQPDTGYFGEVDLLVREPDDFSGYVRPPLPSEISRGDTTTYRLAYRYPQGTAFAGTADVTAGKFEFSFKVPRFAATGRGAFVLAYAQDGVIDAVAKVDDMFFRSPAASDSAALRPSDGPPRVTLGFKGGLRTVKPGAILQARVRDADGVNILSTTPEGKVALVFDAANLPLDVTEFFAFDHGGTDTSGTLEFPLPDLDVGDHRAVLKTSDSFGQTSLDTLQFSVTDPLAYEARFILNFPNPFESSTYFLFELTDPARVALEIFTLSGRRIRRLVEQKSAGEAWILWDGRDSVGDEIANGAYLYVANVAFEGVDRPALVLRGKIVKIE